VLNCKEGGSRGLSGEVQRVKRAREGEPNVCVVTLGDDWATEDTKARNGCARVLDLANAGKWGLAARGTQRGAENLGSSKPLNNTKRVLSSRREMIVFERWRETREETRECVCVCVLCCR
jgi:hypothetical protein